MAVNVETIKTVVFRVLAFLGVIAKTTVEATGVAYNAVKAHFAPAEPIDVSDREKDFRFKQHLYDLAQETFEKCVQDFHMKISAKRLEETKDQVLEIFDLLFDAQDEEDYDIGPVERAEKIIFIRLEQAHQATLKDMLNKCFEEALVNFKGLTDEVTVDYVCANFPAMAKQFMEGAPTAVRKTPDLSQSLAEFHNMFDEPSTPVVELAPVVVEAVEKIENVIVEDAKIATTKNEILKLVKDTIMSKEVSKVKDNQVKTLHDTFVDIALVIASFGYDEAIDLVLDCLVTTLSATKVTYFNECLQSTLRQHKVVSQELEVNAVQRLTDLLG